MMEINYELLDLLTNIKKQLFTNLNNPHRIDDHEVF